MTANKLASGWGGVEEENITTKCYTETSSLQEITTFQQDKITEGAENAEQHIRNVMYLVKAKKSL